jgi:hypothetical protein
VSVWLDDPEQELPYAPTDDELVVMGWEKGDHRLTWNDEWSDAGDSADEMPEDVWETTVQISVETDTALEPERRRVEQGLYERDLDERRFAAAWRVLRLRRSAVIARRGRSIVARQQGRSRRARRAASSSRPRRSAGDLAPGAAS